MIQTLITDYFYPINKKQIKKQIKKQLLIIDFYSKFCENIKQSKKRKIIYGYNFETDSWHCTKCGIDMGSSNPRQLCRKIYCENM